MKEGSARGKVNLCSILSQSAIKNIFFQQYSQSRYIAKKQIFHRKNVALYRKIQYTLSSEKTLGGKPLAKGLNIWILSTLTFISLVHAIDAAIAFFAGNPAMLLKTYPFVGSYLAQIPTNLYLCASAGSGIALWCITCLVAFNNPIESILEHTLMDCQEEQEKDHQLVEEHSDFFDLMYQNMEDCKEELGKTVDLVMNVRSEVKDMQRMRETFDETKDELVSLRKQVKLLEEKMLFPIVCRACGKPLRADFSLCPYCGAEIDIKQEAIVCEPNFFR